MNSSIQTRNLIGEVPAPAKFFGSGPYTVGTTLNLREPIELNCKPNGADHDRCNYPINAYPNPRA